MSKKTVFFILRTFMDFFTALFTVTSITCEELNSERVLFSWCVGMPAKKVRVEVFNNGDRYTITFEGQVTREKALRLLDLVELLGGMPTVPPETNFSTSQLSKIDKVRLVVEKKFPIGWFSSRDIQVSYEEQFNEPIRLSTVSTYLSRLADRGVFTKESKSNQRRYRIVNSISDYQIHKRDRHTHIHTL
jgi:hypothetical protein